MEHIQIFLEFFAQLRVSEHEVVMEMRVVVPLKGQFADSVKETQFCDNSRSTSKTDVWKYGKFSTYPYTALMYSEEEPRIALIWTPIAVSEKETFDNLLID